KTDTAESANARRRFKPRAIELDDKFMIPCLNRLFRLNLNFPAFHSTNNKRRTKGRLGYIRPSFIFAI
ncbi:MAG TPA: hypothetical protein VM870_09705, partial [Pyrinomonadaceae bacterium]|nr:hypothetical protein [Pyrinomonadaceae bacterium]